MAHHAPRNSSPAPGAIPAKRNFFFRKAKRKFRKTSCGNRVTIPAKPRAGIFHFCEPCQGIFLCKSGNSLAKVEKFPHEALRESSPDSRTRFFAICVLLCVIFCFACVKFAFRWRANLWIMHMTGITRLGHAAPCPRQGAANFQNLARHQRPRREVICPAGSLFFWLPNDFESTPDPHLIGSKKRGF